MINQDTLDFHREMMQRKLDALEEGNRLNKEQEWKIAYHLYTMYYKDKVPVEELNIYKHEHK
jgi:hypothetical protein